MRTKTIKRNVVRAAMTLLLAVLTSTAWAEKFITDVMLIGAETESEANSMIAQYQEEGWTIIKPDLNSGIKWGDGDGVYLLYKSEENTDGFNHGYITDFYLLNRGAANTPDNLTYNGRTYNLVPYAGARHFVGQKGDLNSHTGVNTDAIHLFYTKDTFADNHVVTGITINETQSGAVGKEGDSQGYDLNAGCEALTSKQLYMHLTTTTAPVENCFISELKLIGGTKGEVNALKDTYGKQGWKVIDKDLNAGAGGDYIYLLYKTEISPDGFNYGYITGFYLQNKSAANTAATLSYEGHKYNIVPYEGSGHFIGQKGDLNSNTGRETDAIHLFYTTDVFSDNRAVTGIAFDSNSSGAVGKDGGSSGYDLNAKAGGDYIYMHYTTATTVPLFSGEGTTANPFLIRSTDDWNILAACVNRGLNADKCYRLTDNISVSTMVGISGYPFCGTFDGNGQTLTVDVNSSEEATAPFRSVKDGTIKNLVIAGNVSSSANHAAGLVGGCRGTIVIRNCNVTATVSSDTYAGGFVGHGGDGNTLTMENCVFSGTISNFSNFAGGLLGWCDNLTLKMSDCLFKGAFAPASGGKFHPIALKWDKGVVNATVTDTYYLNTIIPSTALGNNFIPGVQGEPVNPDLVEEEWDKAVTAADGKTYYARGSRISMPYYYGFEDGLNGWTMRNCHDESGITTAEKRNGSNSFTFYDCDFSQYLISPELHATSPVEMRFRIKGGSETLAGFKVGVSTTTPDINKAFTWDESQIGVISDWTEVVVRMTSEVKYVAIQYLDTSAQLFLDDFSFEEPYPNPVNLTMDELTAHTATLSWEAAPNANVLRFVYQYHKTGEDQWAQVTTTNTSVALTGLEAKSEYVFRVKAVYDGGQESNYLAATFTTKPDVMSLPFTDGFENGLGGWSVTNNDENTGVNTEASHEGNNGFMFAKSDKQQYLISPQLDDSEPMKVTFWFRNADSNSSVDFYVGYATEITESGMKLGRVTASGGEWKQGVAYCPVGTKYFFIICKGIDDAIYLDDFSFSVGVKVVRGDANGDGELNSEDIVEMINAIAGNPSENFKMENADLNEDKIITVADIVIFVNEILGK